MKPSLNYHTIKWYKHQNRKMTQQIISTREMFAHLKHTLHTWNVSTFNFFCSCFDFQRKKSLIPSLHVGLKLFYAHVVMKGNHKYNTSGRCRKQLLKQKTHVISAWMVISFNVYIYILKNHILQCLVQFVKK